MQVIEVPAPTQRQTELLLDRLCVQLGFCLPPLEKQRLIEAPPSDAEAFTDAVLDAEELKPREISLTLYRQVKAMVADTFNRAGYIDCE